jgi:hypothetical protein
LREQGRGFGMSVWIEDYKPGDKQRIDNVSRKIPVCGTAACIGGSIAFLNGDKNWWTEQSGGAIGLSEEKAAALFHGWTTKYVADGQWPAKYQERYKKAKTPLGKAKVAVALLNEVVKTNGDCLITVEEL